MLGTHFATESRRPREACKGKYLLMQGVKHFKDIQYNRQAKYGEILQQQEYEMSCFNLEEADIKIYQQLYDLYEQVSPLLLSHNKP